MCSERALYIHFFSWPRSPGPRYKLLCNCLFAWTSSPPTQGRGSRPDLITQWLRPPHHSRTGMSSPMTRYVLHVPGHGLFNCTCLNMYFRVHYTNETLFCGATYRGIILYDKSHHTSPSFVWRQTEQWSPHFRSPLSRASPLISI